MTKYFILTFCIFCSFLVFSQEKDSIKIETVLLHKLDNPPLFPGCENLSVQLQKECLQKEIQIHIAKNINSTIPSKLGLKSEKTRIIVQFIIDKKGKIKEIKARGEHRKLEKEAIRVIKLLPKMEPGIYKGEAANVRLSIPITLNVKLILINADKN